MTAMISFPRSWYRRTKAMNKKQNKTVVSKPCRKLFLWEKSFKSSPTRVSFSCLLWLKSSGDACNVQVWPQECMTEPFNRVQRKYLFCRSLQMSGSVEPVYTSAPLWDFSALCDMMDPWQRNTDILWWKLPMVAVLHARGRQRATSAKLRVESEGFGL